MVVKVTLTSSRNHCCNGKATKRLVFIVDLHATVKNVKILCCTKLLLWLIYVAGNNKTYLGFHVKCPIICSDFNQLRIFSTHFYKSP
jgi:hypothetical protein